MKIRTQDELLDRLDNEVAWRIREISEFTLLAKSSSLLTQRALIRGGVALAYAHLEGFVKTASEVYLSFIESRGLRFSQLNDNFITFGVKKHIHGLIDSKSHVLNTEVVNKILNVLDEKARFSFKSAVKTESNLKSDVFSNIAASLGIMTTFYEGYYNFMDDVLLKNRNKIAHGEYILVSIDEFDSMCKDVILIIRAYKTDIENLTVTESYKR